MNQDGKIESFSSDLAELQSEYSGSSMQIIKTYFDDIEHSLSMKVPMERITEKLNSRFDLNMKPATVSQYLWRIRQSKKPDRASSTSLSRPKSSTAKKKTATTASVEKIAEDSDQWNETEKLVGYRLEDCIRPYVQVVDGNIVRNFKKGTIYNAEIRKAIQRLRNVVDTD